MVITLQSAILRPAVCMKWKKVVEKLSFSRVLAYSLCVLVTTPPSSTVLFSVHMLPIRQSDLHDVSMAGKPVLLSRCERKGGKWGEQNGQKKVWRRKQTIVERVVLVPVSWSVVFVRSVVDLVYTTAKPHAAIISYPTAWPDTILMPQFPHLLTLQRNPLCKHYY